MEHIVILLPLYVVLGCLVGFCAGLLGIGGGILLVPGLYAFEKYFGNGDYTASGLMPMALATSMAVIIPTGLSSSYAQIKRKAVRWDAIQRMAPGLVLGVGLGVSVVSKLDSDTLRIIFSVALMLIAILIYTRKDTQAPMAILLKSYVVGPATAAIGLLATMLGVGGAILNVPYLNRSGIPIREAIASSSVLGVVVALPAAIGFLVKGYMDGNILLHFNWMAWCIIAPLSILMAPIGVKTSHKLPVQRLKLIFSGLLVLIAIRMLCDS